MSLSSDRFRRARGPRTLPAFPARLLAPLAAAAGAALAVAAAACSDRVAAPAPSGATAATLGDGVGSFRTTVYSGAGGTVPVQVPSAMRSAPFDVGRVLTVPSGYGVAVYARVGGARFMAAAPNGDLLVSNPGAGAVYRVRPGTPGVNNGDPVVTTWASGLRQPHDVVFHVIGGATYVYVSETDKVGRYTWDANAATAQNRQVLITGLPSVSDTALHGAYAHQLKNIALGPDHKLYVSIASSCNVCTTDVASDPVRGAVYVYNSDGTNGRLFARGIRNAEGLAFVPGTNVLWAAVNNRDNTAYPYHKDFDGDGSDDYGKVLQAYVNNHPPDEFIRVADGANFGWPFCNPNPDGGVDNMPFDRDVQMNADGSQLDCAKATTVNKGIPAHSAALGLTFFQGTKAPASLRNGAAVALHGSWNRSPATGAKVVYFPWNGTAPGAQQDLASGWLANGSYWGRPVDVAVDSAGRVFISDDQSGTIYQLYPVAPQGPVTSGVARANVCLDIKGGTAAPPAAGAPLQAWQCHGGANQQLALQPTGAITAYNGQLCLDVSGGAANNGDAVIAYPCHGGPNQKWTLTAAGQLQTAVNGKCLDLWGAQGENGAAIKVYTCHGGANQRWTVSGASASGSAVAQRADSATGSP